MARIQMRAFVGTIVGVQFALLGAGTTLAQNTEPDKPAAPPPATQPTGAPPLRAGDPPKAQPSLEEMKARAKASAEAREAARATQPAAPAPGAPAPGEPVREEWVGPPAVNRPVAGSESGALPGGQDEWIGPPADSRPAAPAAAAQPPREEWVGPPAMRSAAGEAAPPPPDVSPKVVETTGEPPAAPEPPTVGDSHQQEPRAFFTFDKTPWEEVIKVFVGFVGKPLMGDELAMPTGELTYVSDKKFTLDEAIDELNLIMLDQQYRFVELENHVRIIPLNEMKQWVPVKETFTSREAFESAKVRDMDFVCVMVRVQDRPAQQYIDLFYEALPEYVLMSELSESNQIRIFAVARDVRRFLHFIDTIPIDRNDPRKTVILPIETNAVEIERMVRELLNLGSGAGAPRFVRDPRTGRVVPQAPAGEDDTDVRMSVDERTNTIIVKATPEKLSEIEQLIKEIDKRPDGFKFETQVVPVHHANAAEIATLMTQIFQQEIGSSMPAWQRSRVVNVPGRPPVVRPGQPPQPGQPGGVQAVAPESLMLQGAFELAKKTVRIVAHDASNSLIVYANEEGQKRVVEMLETLDQPNPANYRIVTLENAKAADIADTANQILQNLDMGGTRNRGQRPTVVASVAGDSLYVFAERELMEEAVEVVKQLDVTPEEGVRHLVELKNLAPSRVAEMLPSFLADSTAGNVRAPVRRFPGRGPVRSGPSSSGTAQFLPLDEANLLIVVCSDDDWEKIDELIQTWDNGAINDTPQLEQFVVERGDPQSIATTLSSFYRVYRHKTLGQSQVQIWATGDTIFVQAVRPAIDEIGGLVKAMDIEDPSNQIVILPLVHADAAQVAEQARTLVQAGRGGPGARGGSAGQIQADPQTNVLLVQTDPATLEKVKDFALKMDSRVAAQQPEQRFYTPTYAAPQDIVTAVSNFFAASGGGRSFRGASIGAQVKALVSGKQVVVEAPVDKFAAIENLISELDDPRGREILIKTYKLPNMDVQLVATKLSNAFGELRRTKPNITARFDPDAATESILVTCSQDVLKDIEAQLEEYGPISAGLEPQTQFVELKHASAGDGATWLRDQLNARLAAQGRNLTGRIAVSADARTNRIIIVGPRIAVEEGLKLVALYDVADGGESEVAVEQRFYSVENAEAKYVADQVTQILNSQVSRRMGQDAASRVNIVVDERLNRIVINAPKRALAMAEELISQLDVPSTLQSPVQVIEVLSGDAANIASNLQRVFAEALRSNRNYQITPEPATNSIIVSAGKELMPRIRELITQLDQMAGLTSGGSEVIPLRSADPSEVVAALQARFTPRGARPAPGRDMSFGVFGGSNVVVQAPSDKLEDIRTMINTLEAAAAETASAPESIVLQYADPNQMQSTISTMFGGRGRGAQEVQVSVANGTLVVKAPARTMKQIKSLIEEIDTSDPNALQVRLYPLKVLNATDTAQKVSLYLATTKGVQRTGSMSPGAFAEERTNTLIVLAPASTLPFIEGLISKLEGLPPNEVKIREYVLQNARAETVAPNVQNLLRAKVAERQGMRGGRAAGAEPGVFADAPTNRLFVAAPEEYQPLVDELITMVDQQNGGGEVVRIIRLEQGEARGVADSLRQAVGSAGPGGAARVNIVPEAGSNSILLRGLARDVAEVEGWVADIVANTETVPELHIFALENSDPEELSDLLERVFPVGRGASPADVATFTADTYGNRLLVTATNRQMSKIESLVRQFDRDPDESMVRTGRQLYFIDVYRGDANDIVWEIPDGYFRDSDKGGPEIDADWDGRYIRVLCRPSEFPEVEKVLREIEQRIKVDSVVKVRKVPNPEVIKQLLATHGGDIEVKQVDTGAATSTLVERLRSPDDPPPQRPKRRPRNGDSGDRPNGDATPARGAAVRPFELGVPLSLALLDEEQLDELGVGAPAAAQPAPTPEAPQPAPAAQPAPAQPRRADDARPATPTRGGAVRGSRAGGDGHVETRDLGRDVRPATTIGRSILVSDEPAERQPRPAAPPPATPAPAPKPAAAVQTPESAPARPAPPTQREKPQVVVQPDGTVMIYGPEADVDDLMDAIDLLEEDLAVGEVIKIFEFTYGDVNAAAQILDKMFNERQIVMPQPQQPQQPNQQRRGGEQGGREDSKESGPMAAIQAITGAGGRSGGRGGRQQGGQRVRMATDPGHNYLIVKCDATDLPEIRQLLLELDIPPGQVDIKIFQLKNLDATETATNIKEVLGIEQARSRRANPFGGGRVQGQPGNPQQAQLMQMMQQEMVALAGAGGEAAKIESVEIVPNAITNSLMVSSPPDVMEIIEGVIADLEELETREVVTIRYYKLDNSRVEELVPLLLDVFGSAGGGGGRRTGGMEGVLGGGGRAPRGGGSSPAALGPVSISGDPRSNTVIYTCETKDVPLVEEQIRKLDIPGSLAEVETYVCQWGDATAIAEAVDEAFGAAAGGAGGRDRSASAAATGVRITAESFTNTILVFGPVDKRDQVFRQIVALDERSQNAIREIDVLNGDPEQLAERLTEMFGGTGGALTGGGDGRRPGGRRAAASTPGRILILGDKNAKKLFVRAPEPIFQQIRELALTLDQPSDQLNIKRYALKNADAEFVVDSVKSGMMELIVQMPRDGSGAKIDPFTAVADPRSNSILVVGSSQTFMFVDRVISEIDQKIPEGQETAFRIFVLRRADAQTVADAINGFAGGAAAGGAQPASDGGRRRGGLPGLSRGPAAAPKLLNVTAVPELTTNSVMVFGRIDHIDQVKVAVIDRLEQQMEEMRQFAQIPVQNVPASQLAARIRQMISDTAAADPARGPGGRTAPGATPGGPLITPNDRAKQIIVRGSAAEIAEVEDLAAWLDDPAMIDEPIKVFPVPPGQDPTSLAATIERVVNEGEEIRAQRLGVTPNQIAVEANPDSRTLIVYGDSSTYSTIEKVLKDIATVGPGPTTTRLVKLTNLSPEEAARLVEDLQRSRSGGAGGTRRTGGNRGGFQPGGFFPGGGFQPGGFQPGGARARVQAAEIARRRRNPDDRGSWLWPPRDSTVFVGMASLAPTILLAAAEPAFGDAAIAAALDDEPAPRAQRPPAATRPARRPPPRRPAAAAEESAAQPERAAAARPAADTAAAEPPASEPQTQPGAPELLTGVSGELRGDVTVSTLDDGIILSGDEADIEFIVQMLALMETQTQTPQVQVFPLERANAVALQPTLDRIVQSLVRAGPQTGRAQQYSISAEARSNSLVVAAPDRLMTQIADIILRLDVDREGVDFRLVPLIHVGATQIIAKVQQAVQRLAQIEEVPASAQPQVDADENSNSILVIGTAKYIEKVERLIQALDVEVPEDEDRRSDWLTSEFMFVGLKNAVADDVAEVLNQLIEAERSSGGAAAGAGGGRAAGGAAHIRKLKITLPDGTQLPELDLSKPIRILPDKGTNSLIIYSNPKNNEALQQVVGLFDTLPIGADTDVKAFALKHAQAQKVAELLDKLFKDSKAPLKRPGEGEGTAIERGVLPSMPPGLAGRGLPFQVAVSHDERTNTVFVVGRKDAVVLAGGIINELDKSSVDLGYRTYVLSLKNLQAPETAEKLKTVVTDRAKALKGDQNEARDSAVIIPDDRSNALIIFATEDVYDMLEDLVTTLDGAENYRVVETRYHKLQFADSKKIEGLLQELFDKKSEAITKSSPKAETKDALTVLSDGRSNGLLLTGTRDYLNEAEGLIADLDKRFDPTVQFKVRKVELNSAVNIAALLTDMIDKALAEKDSKMSGSPKHIAADAISNTLLIAASIEDMQLIDRWVEILDRPPSIGAMTRIIPLARANAETVAETVTNVFREGGRGGGGGAAGGAAPAGSDMSITHDPATNSVIAFGPPAIIAEVEKFVRDLDQVTPVSGAQIKLIKLEQADARDAVDLLNNILQGRGGAVGTTGGSTTGGGTRGTREEAANQIMLIYQRSHPELGQQTLRAMRSQVVVTADVRSNSLILTAPPESIAMMESLVEAIDIPPTANKIRVFALHNSDAEQMVQTLNDLFSQRTSAGGTSGRSTTTGGGARTTDEERTLSLGEIGGGRQEISFSTDIRTNSVIAAGTPGYLDLAEQLVLQLDNVALPDRKTFVYSPKNIPAETLVTSLQEYGDREKGRLDELGEDVSMFRKQERELIAIANTDANRVILSVDPAFESSILDMVRELDQAPPQVMIQVLIMEVTMDNALELGVEFAWQDLQFTKAGPNDTTTFDYVGGTDIGAAGSGLGGFTFTITGADFNFLLRTLQNEGSLNVLSRPQIVAMDNQEASIEIVNDVPYVTGTSTTTGGQITTSVAREEVGITLNVTPQINPDGFVRMQVRQEVSDFTGSTVDVGQGVTAPVFFRRIAETVVSVKDNETVVLGGLITTRQEKREQKVPLVGDIPGLGLLFRNQSDTVSRTELLVMLTPRVVRTPDDYRNLSLEERDRLQAVSPAVLQSEMMQGMRIRPEELTPGIEDDLTPPPAGESEPLDGNLDDDEYGPVRPALRPTPQPLKDDSYDVPIALRPRT